jgi:SNF2 family DNA or RNA helicase
MKHGRRAVVFSQWTAFLDLVGSMLDDAAVPYRLFTGSLSREERRKHVEWLSEEEPVSSKNGRVLLISLKAGGTGLNLVAATRLYLLDMWWNPAVEEQAIQRVHRIGQRSEVHVYRFIVTDSIDTDVLELHRAKERLLEDALHGGLQQEAASKLTIEDFKKLFNPCRKSLAKIRAPTAAADNSHVSTSTPAFDATSFAAAGGC